MNVGSLVLRFFAVALLAYGAFRGLDALGVAAWMGPVAVVVSALMIGVAYWQRKQTRESETRFVAWESTLADPPSRARAITEIRAELQRTQPHAKRMIGDRAQLSLVLAQLLDAAGRADEACDVLARVPVEEMKPIGAAVVRQARLVAQLSAGRLDDAQATITAHRPPTDAATDARIELGQRQLWIERGELDRAEADLAAIDELAKTDDTDLAADVVALRAMIADARGERARARELLGALPAEQLEALRAAGPTRVKAILGDAEGAAS